MGAVGVSSEWVLSVYHARVRRAGWVGKLAKHEALLLRRGVGLVRGHCQDFRGVCQRAAGRWRRRCSLTMAATLKARRAGVSLWMLPTSLPAAADSCRRLQSIITVLTPQDHYHRNAPLA